MIGSLFLMPKSVLSDWTTVLFMLLSLSSLSALNHPIANCRGNSLLVRPVLVQASGWPICLSALLVLQTHKAGQGKARVRLRGQRMGDWGDPEGRQAPQLQGVFTLFLWALSVAFLCALLSVLSSLPPMCSCALCVLMFSFPWGEATLLTFPHRPRCTHGHMHTHIGLRHTIMGRTQYHRYWL